jgi:hypothetical protein
MLQIDVKTLVRDNENALVELQSLPEFGMDLEQKTIAELVEGHTRRWRIQLVVKLDMPDRPESAEQRVVPLQLLENFKVFVLIHS